MMSRYEIVVPPMCQWVPLWKANMAWLVSITLGRTWTQLNSLRNDPPMEWS